MLRNLERVEKMEIEKFYENDGQYDGMITTGKISMSEIKDNGWRCELIDGVIWSPPNGNAPNWFHRKMQQLIFGIRWFNVNKDR